MPLSLKPLVVAAAVGAALAAVFAPVVAAEDDVNWAISAVSGVTV